MEILSRSPEVHGLTMEKRLRAIDALLGWSDRLHEQQGEAPWATSSAVELAERLYDEAVTAASSYFSDSSNPEGTVTNEEAQQASPRAVWYPHPDDPPQG